MLNLNKVIQKKNIYISQKKFINFNNKIFKNFKKKNAKDIFLIEFNAFQDYHGVYSALAYHLKKKINIKIVSYFNYYLVVSPLKFNFFSKFKWIIGSIFGLKTFGIYKSFCTESFLRPEILKHQKLNSIRYFKSIFFKIKSKEDILNIKYKKVLIGDLIYDSFIKFNLNTRANVLGTIDFKSKNFKEYLLNFFQLTDYWLEYFEKNSIKGVVACHGGYSYGLPLRIATYKRINSYVMTSKTLLKYNNQTMFSGQSGTFKNYKQDFKKLNKKVQIKGVSEAKKEILLRFQGQTGSKVNRDNEDISSFNKKIYNRLLLNNKKLNVLICPHDFFDAIHLYGKSIFVDFYEWLFYLGETSKNTNYNWYIKNHPNWGGRYKIYQKYSEEIVDEFKLKFPNIKLLPNNCSMLQLIDEGVDAVLTVYGTVGIEFPHFKIPVVTATKNCPYSNFNFTKMPLNKKDYSKILYNLDKLKTPQDAKNQIYIYYFMRNILPDKNWLFSDYDKFLKDIGGYHNLRSENFYNYWSQDMSEELLIRASQNIGKFIKSKNSRFLSDEYMNN